MACVRPPAGNERYIGEEQIQVRRLDGGYTPVFGLPECVGRSAVPRQGGGAQWDRDELVSVMVDIE